MFQFLAQFVVRKQNSNVLLPLVSTKREKGRARRKRNEARIRARGSVGEMHRFLLAHWEREFTWLERHIDVKMGRAK